MAVEPKDLEELERLLGREEGLAHLRVKKRGDTVTLRSGDGAGEQNHARLTQLRRGTWGLSFPHHSGRWERAPFVGSMQELIATLVSDFSFYLDPG